MVSFVIPTAVPYKRITTTEIGLEHGSLQFLIHTNENNTFLSASCKSNDSNILKNEGFHILKR